MDFPIEFLKTEMLFGRLPRHVFDVDLDALDVAPSILESARLRVSQAGLFGQDIAEEVERAFHELSCIEDAGLSGAFRRLIAVACIALDIQDRLAVGAFGTEDILGIHKAVEERWSGATYELSDCMATLEAGAQAGRDSGAALGAWLWFSLLLPEESRYLQWVRSTRRFEDALGSRIVDRVRSRGIEAPPAEQGLPYGGVSAEEAKAIAAKHVTDDPVPGLTGRVTHVFLWDQLPWRKPLVYGKDEDFWKRQWIVYLEREGLGIRSSAILAVDRETGAIGYAGPANDEW